MMLDFETHHYRLARHYLNKLRAAENAFRRGHENAEYAQEMFDQEWLQIRQWWAWTAAQDDDTSAQLCSAFSLVGAELLSVRLHPHERLQLWEAGLAAAQRLGDAPAEMVHLFLLARTQTRVGLRDVALNATHQALAIAERLNDRLYIGRLSTLLGNILYRQDEYEQALPLFEKALAFATELDEKIDMGLAVNGLGHISHIQGDYENSIRYDSEYLRIAEVTGQPYDVCMALRNLSGTAMQMGDEAAAIEYAERCVTLCEAIGYQTCLVGVLVILGDLVAARGDLVASRGYYLRSLAISREIDHPTNEALTLCQLGRLSRLLGDIPASLEYHEAALVLSEAIGERWYSASALLEMASTFRTIHDIRQACLKLWEGLEIASTFQSAIMQVIYLLEAALLWNAQGDLPQAAQWLGVLEANFSILPTESYADYQLLQEKLAHVELATAVEQGKSLNLDNVMAELLQQLKVVLFGK